MVRAQGSRLGSAGFQCSVMEKGSVAVRLLPLMGGGVVGGVVIDR